jgi:hypothetical protein
LMTAILSPFVRIRELHSERCRNTTLNTYGTNRAVSYSIRFRSEGW